VHLAFSAENGYYNAIISSTLAFLLPTFVNMSKGRCLLELWLKVKHYHIVRFRNKRACLSSFEHL
jgi:hypothetical protein